MLFTVEINKRPVIFGKFGALGLCHEVITAVSKAKPSRVVMIDCDIKPASIATAVLIGRMNIPLVIRDHCDIKGEPIDEDQKQVRLAVQALQDLSGTETIISNHDDHKYCHMLVNEAEFDQSGNLIVADMDADGLAAACKAVGLPMTDSQFQNLRADLDNMKKRISKDNWDEREMQTIIIFGAHLLQLTR